MRAGVSIIICMFRSEAARFPGIGIALSGTSHQHDPPTSRSTLPRRRRTVRVLTSSQHIPTPTFPSGVWSTPSSEPPTYQQFSHMVGWSLSCVQRLPSGDNSTQVLKSSEPLERHRDARHVRMERYPGGEELGKDHHLTALPERPLQQRLRPLEVVVDVREPGAHLYCRDLHLTLLLPHGRAYPNRPARSSAWHGIDHEIAGVVEETLEEHRLS